MRAEEGRWRAAAAAGVWGSSSVLLDLEFNLS